MDQVPAPPRRARQAPPRRAPRPARLCAALLCAALLCAALPLPGLAEAQMLVAARPIARGETIAPEALQLRPGPAPPGVARQPADAVGRTARRAIAAGAPLRADALAPALAVRRGEPVVLRARVGAAVIEAPGVAEADAPAGAPVSARNALTGARLRGRASQPGTVDLGP